MEDHGLSWQTKGYLSVKKWLQVLAGLFLLRWMRLFLPQGTSCIHLWLQVSSHLRKKGQQNQRQGNSMVLVVVGCRGSHGLLPGWDAWHGMHDFTVSPANLSILGNHTFSLMHCFVLTMPWWAWWAMAMVFWHRVAGIIMWFCLRISPS